MKEATETNTLAELIAAHPFFHDLPPQHIGLLTEAAMLKEFKAGEVIFQEGDPANRFYIIQNGEVELLSEGKEGAAVSLQKIGPGDVLGWSWLFPPYHWQFEARAVTATKAIFFYGTWLRESCERDHDFGYMMLTRMSAVVVQRLQGARKRLVDLSA